MIDELPTLRRKNGMLEGPGAGCVIQILRSTVSEGVLRSGRVAAGIDDDDAYMKDVVKTTWACVKQLGSTGVLRPDGRVDKNYLVGDFAKEAIERGNIQIADRAVGMPYELVD